MKDWGIKKLLYVTLDNDSANDNPLEWLKWNTTVTEDIVRDNGFIQVWCVAHILNLLAVEGLEEVDESILKVQNLVRYVKAFPQRLGQFTALVKQLDIPLSSSMLCLNVFTTWNSTYIMLEVVKKL